jgi:hypothetical protein
MSTRKCCEIENGRGRDSKRWKGIEEEKETDRKERDGQRMTEKRESERKCRMKKVASDGGGECEMKRIKKRRLKRVGD